MEEVMSEEKKLLNFYKEMVTLLQRNLRSTVLFLEQALQTKEGVCK